MNFSLSDLWDRFKNGNANVINSQIAQSNLDFQKERASIEDSRYEEETAYNRALQQELFNREDTALERQAQSLSNMGINPLSQQLNGLGAGSTVGTSTRVAETPQNNFQAIPGGLEGVLSAFSGLADTVNGVATGQYNRDALALENDRKYLENIKLAHDLGLDYDFLSTSKNKRNTSSSESKFNGDSVVTNIYPSIEQTPQYQNTKGNYFNRSEDEKRQLEGKKNFNLFDWESSQTKLIKSLGTLDFQSIAESLLTNIADAGNWVNGNLKDFSKDMDNNAIMKFVKKFFAF